MDAFCYGSLAVDVAVVEVGHVGPVVAEVSGEAERLGGCERMGRLLVPEAGHDPANLRGAERKQEQPDRQLEGAGKGSRPALLDELSQQRGTGVVADGVDGGMLGSPADDLAAQRVLPG